MPETPTPRHPSTDPERPAASTDPAPTGTSAVPASTAPSADPALAGPSASTAAPLTARPEDERLPLPRSLVYGAQHVLSMYGGVVAVPLIVGGAAGLPGDQIGVLVASALFVSGVTTLLQSLGIPFFGAKLPLVQGTTFGAVSTMLVIIAGDGGLPSVFGSVIVAGIVGFLLAPVVSRLQPLFPPVVTGTIIAAMGISLLPVAAGWIMGTEGAPGYGSALHLGLAALTLVAVLVFSRIRALSGVAILLGIAVGTVIAAIVGAADFSEVLTGSVVALPRPFAFGVPTFHLAAIVPMVVVIIVTLMETTANLFAVTKVVGTDLPPRRLADGLRADMAASALAPLVNSFPATAFAQNIGLISVTRVRSRFTVAAGGVILVLLGLVPLLGRVVAAVPQPVLGGAGLVLFGSVAAAGIRTIGEAPRRDDRDAGHDTLIVAVSLSLAVLPVAVPALYDALPSLAAMVLGSGVSAAAFSAVLLNLLLKGRGGIRPHDHL
ncbi:nucleobase:cation symporter-2 family protein [Brachybacterium kimchii]|uniref:Purine/pyrimidine permease n=1 Tax=Brachybacterium kimchii TaxID=2942909 RepID=A0ABY4N9N4_9MICO|nr:nucleobase:cation symporter-2 family protein [Brachybacterium kimchii]UQN31227.1 purine/pyrimidine permease [Brachybacterium kimchii]